MQVNMEKTKVMVFRRGGRRGKEGKWEFNGQEIKVVIEFKYLNF